MPLSSMTGYARGAGSLEGLNWQWEVRSVNGKGLEVRTRLVPGFESLEVAVRESVQRQLRRGNVQVTLTCDRGGSHQKLVVNEGALEQALALAQGLWKRLRGEPPRAENILALRGVLDVATSEDETGLRSEREKAMLGTLAQGLAALASN